MSDVVVGVQVKINSIDVTSHLLEFSLTQYWKNQPAKCNLKFKSSIDSVLSSWGIGSTIEIWRKLGSSTITDPTDKIFKGEITKKDLNKKFYSVSAEDELIKCRNKDINVIYFDTDPQAGVISEIFKDIVEVKVGGLTTNTTSSSTLPKLKIFKCLKTDALERMRKLAEILKWQFYYDASTDKVIFEPEGNSTNSNILTTGAGNEILNYFRWSEDKKDLANHITIQGGTQLVQTEESFSGDGSTTEFTLNRKPQDIRIELSGVVQTISVQGTGTAQVYVQKETKKITFNTAPPSGTNNIVVKYSYFRPIIVSKENPASVASYGRHDKTFNFSDITDVDDAINRLNKLLDILANPFLTASINLHQERIKNYGIKAGQKIRVDDNINNVDNTFLVREYTYNYPKRADKIKVGDREVKFDEIQFNILDRIKRLEERTIDDSDIAYTLLNLTPKMTQKTKTLKVSLNLINDSFIIGNTNHGVLGDTYNKIIDRLNTSASDWFTSGGTISDDSTKYIVAPGSMKIQMSSSVISIGSSKSMGDLSGFTGVSSGRPTKGIIGMWVFIPSGVSVTTIRYQIGSNSSNYLDIIGKRFAEWIGYGSLIGWQQNEWNYVIFDMADTSNAIYGTPNWTAVSQRDIGFTFSSATTFWVDHMGITKNTKSPCFLGDRRKKIIVETLNY